MDNPTATVTVAKCPTCGRPPAQWREQAAHNSRELDWIGCRPCGHLDGGVSRPVAIQRWERTVARIKYEQHVKKNGATTW